MTIEKKAKKTYHHGDLAESLLQAVDDIATQFGFDAITLRGCAKLVGVSPSSAFRHYLDKRALLTAFATRALNQLTARLSKAKENAQGDNIDAFTEVGLAYIEFALDKPAFYRAMWREEAIYPNDVGYVEAANELSSQLKSGFADSIIDDDPDSLSAEETLAWSAVHGLAGLFVDGSVAKKESKSKKIQRAIEMLDVMSKAINK